MYVSPLQLSSNSQIFVSGDVVVDEGATIAPGVILQADPDSKISIAPGVCIGMGAILHAREGTLIVEAGAILGAGVLVVGQGTIGQNACIGAGTTLIDPKIDRMQILPAGSLIGDNSRQVPAETTAAPETPATSPPPVEPVETSVEPPIKPPIEPITEPPAESPPAIEQPQTAAQTPPEAPAAAEKPAAPSGEVPTILYGQAHINRLLGTLFPHRQAFNSPPENGQIPPEESE
ncbi:MAG: carbon dioxide concentrating mechanism protein [Oscillatoriales cyanobacterium RU_3_3]|nr:carbon dioxide concentrating mechanism protein [Microcoleus sp. SM1_3_4]NJM61904.1 carbon dioxide concentrating mechanism protein [Oscillatoriales cyanobacterium RU_3_3]NJR21577.1 carbon dioxide concentrating mechanism protein [Richelia sp. CSU_2_1]